MCGKGVPLGVAGALLAVCPPIAGWLADVHFGRYKVLRVGLWLLWIGSLSMTATVPASYGVGDCLKCQEILQGSGGLVGGTLLFIGLSTYGANAVQFGIDHMPEASFDELVQCIHPLVVCVRVSSEFKDFVPTPHSTIVKE